MSLRRCRHGVHSRSGKVGLLRARNQSDFEIERTIHGRRSTMGGESVFEAARAPDQQGTSKSTKREQGVEFWNS